MARTGKYISLALVLLAAAPALAETEFTMSADRAKVGTEDTFRLEISVTNAPEGAVVQFPAPADFEVLSRSESTQMSYSMGFGGAGNIRQTRRYTLLMRATRTGTLTIPPAGLQTGSTLLKTQPVTLEVVSGRTRSAPRQQPRAQNPFGLPPGFPNPFGDLDDEGDPFAEAVPDVAVPRGDSDLFVRLSLDRNEAYVGQQVMMTVTIFSRIDLQSVDSVTLPKLDGFWTHDVQAPTQLSAESRVVDGVPYRAYTLRQKALFPMKPGEVAIEPVEADINTGFLFSGRRMHRVSNKERLVVKALPSPNISAVGRWRLSAEVAQSDVVVGDPIQVKVTLDGRGHLQSVAVPPLQVPAGLKTFEPQTTDKASASRVHIGGTRTIEYVVVPQQTGTFTLPGLTLKYFDPETKQVEETKTDPITVTVRPSAGAPVPPSTAAPSPLSPPVDASQKNQLVAGGLKPLRHQASFRSPSPAPWAHGYFVPVVAAPVAVSVVALLAALLRRALGRSSPESHRKNQARAARKRLAEAEKLVNTGAPAAFYAEVERALRSFLEAKLSRPVSGLTREALDAALQEAEIGEAERKRVLAVFDTCDTGRYAPGMGEHSARRRAVDDAAAAMEAWPS